MTQRERKEIIQINGLSILMGMALIANLLIVGFVYRYHGYQLYQEEKAHNQRMSALYKKERDLKEDIVRLEGVKSWNESRFASLIEDIVEK